MIIKYQSSSGAKQELLLLRRVDPKQHQDGGLRHPPHQAEDGGHLHGQQHRHPDPDKEDGGPVPSDAEKEIKFLTLCTELSCQMF